MNSMLRYHLYALFAVTVWGATFVSTKVLIGFGLSPAEIFLIRFLMAYICLLPFAKGKLWADSWQDELRFAGVGITGGSLYFLAENMALEYAPASNVSLIVCSAPVWTALLLALLYRNERMNARQIWGSVVAFLGMVLVVLNGRFVLQIAPKGDLLAFAAAWLWVLYSLIIKQIGHRYKALFITRKTFFYGLLTILPWFLYEPFTVDWATLLHPLVAGNLLFLGVVASMLCYLVWAVAMRELGAVRATNYIYLNPLITILTAAICIAERITPIALLGAGLILYGMWRAERN
ncbi:MAG: DMT family transporter [Alistipes sp.]|nr:DMT family transporter [Alistipes sp.]